MASTPAFSILMAAYRTEPFIETAIRSVLAQTREDWELIVVDDGSPDRLVQRVEPFLSSGKVRLIRQANRGLAAARNTAARSARGRYVVVLDSDDALLPGYLAAVGTAFERRAEVGMVTCDALVYQEERAAFSRRTYLQGPRVDPPSRHDPSRHLERLLHHNFVYPGATIRRGAFDAVEGFDERLRAVEDWDMWIRIAATRFETAVIDRPLAVYRLRMGSLSRDLAGANRLDEPSEQMLINILAEVELAPSERRAALAALAYCRRRSRLNEARAALLTGDVARARERCRLAFQAQRTLKNALMLAALRVAPQALRSLHGRKRSAGRRLRASLIRLKSRCGLSAPSAGAT